MMAPASRPLPPPPPPDEPAFAIAATVQRPLTAEERDLVARFFRRQRAGWVAGCVVGLVLAIAYYLYPMFILFVPALGIVLASTRFARESSTMRKALAATTALEIRGVPEKLGISGPYRGAGLYTLRFGGDTVLVRLPVYDRFGPGQPGSLAYLEGANLAVAANGVPLDRPEKFVRPRKV